MDEQIILDNIRRVSVEVVLPTNHLNYLKKLKLDGFEPKIIYDIGSCVSHWTREARLIWPNARFFLFDGNRDVEFLYKEKDDDYFIGILGDRTGRIIKWYENRILVGGNSYYRENNDQVFPPDQYTYRMTHALDDVVKSMAIPPPDLVKIDVQGAEKDVVDGGIKSLSHAQHLIIEIQDTEYNIGAPKADKTIPYIEKVLNVRCVGYKICDNGPDADYAFAKV